MREEVPGEILVHNKLVADGLSALLAGSSVT